MSPKGVAFTTTSATISGGTPEERFALLKSIENYARGAATRKGLRIQFTNDEETE